MAVNPRTDLKDELNELSFSVSFDTPKSEALELVPLRFGDEQNVETKSGIPPVSVKAGEAEISLGEIYGQTGILQDFKTHHSWNWASRFQVWLDVVGRHARWVGEAVDCGDRGTSKILEH